MKFFNNKLQEDGEVYAILALNTDKGVLEESNILASLGLKPLKVFIDQANRPSYLVDDVSEALAVAYEYCQEDMVILSALNKGQRQAMVVDILTGNISMKGEWHCNGPVQPDTLGWIRDGDIYYTLK